MKKLASILTVMLIHMSAYAYDINTIREAQDIFCNKYMSYFTLGMNDVFKNQYLLHQLLKQDLIMINRFKAELNFDLEGFVKTGYKNGREEAEKLKKEGVMSIDDNRSQTILLNTSETCRYMIADAMLKSYRQ